MQGRKVEWSFHKDPDLIIEAWSTSALIAAVVAALLEDPEKLKRALDALEKSRKS